MANLRGPGGMKQLNLIASWKDSQVTRADKGKGDINGAFLTIEKDQSMMTQKAAKEGKADTNPYIESHTEKGPNGEYTSHNVWYSQSQIDAMTAAGKSAKQADGRNAIAFKADVQKSAGKNGTSRIIVLTPKDVSKAKNDDESAKIEKYNEMHPLGASDNTKFGPKTLEKQEKITALAKENRPVRETAKEAEAEKAADAEPEMS